MISAAKKYHESNNLQKSGTTALFNSVKNHVKSKLTNEGKLIDIGTGDGRVLVETFMKLSGLSFTSVLGTDRRKDVIDFAQKTYGSETLNFQVLDIEHAKEEDFEKILKNGKFDLGTSFWCLHFALDHEKTFKNIQKLLKPGGSFYFNFIGHYNFVDIHYKLAEKYPELKEAIYDDLPLFSKDKNYKEKLPEILRKIGFDITFLNFDTYEHDFGSEKCFRGKV